MLFEVIRGEEKLGPMTAEELRALRVLPDDLLRYEESGPWMHLSTLIWSDAQARAVLEDGVDPDMPPPEPWQQRSLIEYTGPAMLIAADALWLMLAASMNDSAAGWVTALSLLAVMTVGVVGLLRRRAWAWPLSALIMGAMATWLLRPLAAAPNANLGLWFVLNVVVALVLVVRRPRGPALDWPDATRRLLLLYSSDPAREARPIRPRTDRVSPLTAFVGVATFFALVLVGVNLYHITRYPGLELPLSLVPRGGDIWGRIAALGVYALMATLAAVFTLRSKPIMASLGIRAGQGWARALWTGARIFMILFVVLLSSRWVMRTVELAEQRLQGPEVTDVEDTTAGQVRTAVQSALDRTRHPGGLSLQHLWLLAVALLIGPLAEEIFFRGFLFGALRRRWPFWAAALVSSLIFAASHGWGSGWGLAGPVLWFQIAAGGLAAAYSYEITGTLAAPVVLHALWNASQTMTQFIFD